MFDSGHLSKLVLNAIGSLSTLWACRNARQGTRILILQKAEFRSVGSVIDKIVIILGRDVKRVAFFGHKFSRVDYYCDFTFQNHKNLKSKQIHVETKPIKLEKDQKQTRNGPNKGKVDQNWSKIGLKIESKFGSKMDKNWTKIGPKIE